MAAAEEDVGTGGPDLRRDIYPNVVTVSASGFAEVAEERVAAAAQRFGEVLMTMQFYVPPEQMMKDRAEFARKGIARANRWLPSSTPVEC